MKTNGLSEGLLVISCKAWLGVLLSLVKLSWWHLEAPGIKSEHKIAVARPCIEESLALLECSN